MYTLRQESAEDDHYRDSIGTARFLQDDPAATESLDADLAGHRRERQDLGALQPGDLRAFTLVDQVAQRLDAGDTLDT